MCQLCAYLAVEIWSRNDSSSSTESSSASSNSSSSESGDTWVNSVANALAPSAVAFTPVAPLEISGFENSCADRRALFGSGGGRLFSHQVH